MSELLDTLRYRSECTDLDFKQAQYRFIGGTEEDKGELLKDVLALANAWRDGAGYIVLGFKDRTPYPAEVVGINCHIDDAQLQQFINGKVKPKLGFRYEEYIYEGKTIGLITVPNQKRPFYLGHAYGKLKSNVVYVRRGSSTDEAEPPESGAMMAEDAGRNKIRLDLSVLDPNNEELSVVHDLQYLRFPEKLPDYESERRPIGRNGFQIIFASTLYDNRDYWRELGEYVRFESALIELRFILNNRSNVELSNVKLEVTVEALDGQRFEMCAGARRPSEPKNQLNTLTDIPHFDDILPRDGGEIVVDAIRKIPVCRVLFRSLLPGEEVRSYDTLALVPLGPGKIILHFRILAGELATPIESQLKLSTNGPVKALDIEGLKNVLRTWNA